MQAWFPANLREKNVASELSLNSLLGRATLAAAYKVKKLPDCKGALIERQCRSSLGKQP